MHPTNLLRTAVLASTLLLGACAGAPLRPSDLHSPALQQIEAAFARTVDAANNDPQRSWHSGWIGNMWVNFRREDNEGLCYQWKNLVYAGVAPTVRKVGWGVTGIVINQGTAHEHHAVLVYDPARSNRATLLSDPTHQRAFVLDAWRRGRPDIYPLADWLKLSWFKEVPARLLEVHVDSTP